MSDHTKIEWADATVNAVNGCSVTSPGCTNCYAMRLAGTRLKHHPSRIGLTRDSKAGPVWTGEVRLSATALLQPLRWKRPRRIFWNAHGDLFHDAVPDEWIDRVFAVCALTPQHTHMILTKRSARMREYMTALARGWVLRLSRAINVMGEQAIVVADAPGRETPTWPLPNVWLGVSVEDRDRRARVLDLAQTPAAVRFVSGEPLLEHLMLTDIPIGGVDENSVQWLFNALTGEQYFRGDDGFNYGGDGPDMRPIDWVIAGGESGPGARPMHPDWVRSLRDQCAAAGVAFHFKQWGEWELSLDRDLSDPDWREDYTNDYVDHGKSKWLNLAGGCGFHGDRFVVMRRLGKRRTGRHLDGRTHDEFPA